MMYAVKITTECDVAPEHTHTSGYWLENFAALRRVVETSRYPVVGVFCDHSDEFAAPMCEAPDLDVDIMHEGN